MMEDLEYLTDNAALDVEFLVDSDGKIWLLQVRPLTTVRSCPLLDPPRLQEIIQKIQGKVAKLSAQHPFLRGRKGMFSVMTDWNPAEMIGIRPKRLALSLYKRLITDGTWAYQRSNYGYRNLRGFPLLVSLYGAPYIDVRVCFNSFIPATLDDSIAEKLVNYYMERLRTTPTDHDKVEFNVVFSCYDFSLRSRLGQLRAHGFSELELDRITFSLLQLTNNIIAPSGTIHANDRAKIALLEPRFLEIHNAGMPLIDTTHWLIEDCVRYGTLPFAGLARGGFIAMQLLRSLVTEGIMSDGEYHAFMNSLATVSKTLAKDVDLLQQGALRKEDFLERYGHLRPGTYDITSPRYDEAFDTYFCQWNQATASREKFTNPTDASSFTLDAQKREKLDTLIRMNGLQTTPAEILHFIRHAIEGRELGKFLFTKNLSMVLRHLTTLGSRYGLTAEDMAHVDIQVITNLYSSLGDADVGTVLRDSIKQGKNLHTITRALRLPQLISVPADAEHFMASEVEPNFITQGTVTTMVILEEDLHHYPPTGKIVFIKSADPGYDWLFSHNIAGLVTMYGGANSHMAIRCAELSIPAIIGCGEHNFDQWGRHSVLTIDCENRHVNPIQPE
jgi:phosphohistidine swiveling domain-containing protein